MTDGVITFDAQGHVIMANPQAIDIMPKVKENENNYFNILKPMVERVKDSGEYVSGEKKING